MKNDAIEIEWILPDSEKDAFVDAIELGGGKIANSGEIFQPTAEEAPDYAAANFEPLTVITATAAAVFVVQALAKVWRDRNVSGGTIVDTRGGKLRVRRVPAMETGRMVLLSEEGARVVERKNENEGKALLTDIVTSVTGGKK